MARATAEDELGAELHPVGEAERRPRALGQRAADRELVVEAQRRVVAHVDPDDRELEAVAVAQIAVGVTERAQVFHARRLEVGQVGGVVGDPHGVGLGEAHAQIDAELAHGAPSRLRTSSTAT